MKKSSKIIKEKKENISIVGVLHVLFFHIYIMFFFAIIMGVIFDFIFQYKIFNGVIYQYLGLFMITLGTILIYWSQRTTNTSKNDINKERDINFFYRGPYKYTRNPTNFGLTIMSLGLGFLINSFFSVLFILIIHIVSKFILIKKQDKILKERYGEIYSEYLKKVKDWL